MITAQHAKRLVLDTFTLSSLFLRRVLLAQPQVAFREKTRELLISQSRLSNAEPSAELNGFNREANLAAIKLLEWDKEWNLLRYYGLQEYGKRWWGKRSNAAIDVSTKNTRNTAQVAFMITSEQRKVLGEQGYSAEDIRSFKPIEALLLVKHSVQKESDAPNYDFRLKLKELIDENDRLVTAEQSTKIVKTMDVTVTSQETNNVLSYHLSPEDAQQAHAKADVALALLNADKCEGQFAIDSLQTENKMLDIMSEYTRNNDQTVDSSAMSFTSKSDVSSQHTLSKLEPVVRPSDSQELHMKPDIAAAYLRSQLSNKIHQHTEVDLDKDEITDEPCWYEVLEVHDNNDEQIIALFSSKKEASECAQIKESFSARRDQNKGAKSTFIVRRRWNVQ
jgi:hypothetical protein